MRYILFLCGFFVFLLFICDTGFPGPDEPIYFASPANAVEDGDLNIVNQLYAPGTSFLVSKTLNFPDFHNHGATISPRANPQRKVKLNEPPII